MVYSGLFLFILISDAVRSAAFPPRRGQPAVIRGNRPVFLVFLPHPYLLKGRGCAVQCTRPLLKFYNSYGLF
jgi:hypothetical protein